MKGANGSVVLPSCDRGLESSSRAPTIVRRYISHAHLETVPVAGQPPFLSCRGGRAAHTVTCAIVRCTRRAGYGRQGDGTTAVCLLTLRDVPHRQCTMNTAVP